MSKKRQEETDENLKKLTLIFGEGTIITGDSKRNTEVKERVLTSSITLNNATFGGIPKNGKVTCILGKESSSKTTLGLDIIANEQKNGGLCCFIDIEGTLDLDYAESLGVDVSKLHLVDDRQYIKQLGIKDRDIISGEEWLELVGKLLQTNLYDIIVVDSVAALIPMADITNGLVGGKLGSQATMAARGYKLINASIKDRKTGLVYLNQYRLSPGSYIPMYEPFGEAWKYLQALKLEISKSLDKDEDGVYGIVVKGKVSKSKICQPYKKFEYYVEFAKGIVPAYEIINLGTEYGIIDKKGNTYSFKETKLGVGEKQMNEYFNENPKALEEVKVLVMEELNKPKEITVSTE